MNLSKTPTLHHSSILHLQNPAFRRGSFLVQSLPSLSPPYAPSITLRKKTRILNRQKNHTSSIIPACINPAQEIASETSTQDTETTPAVSSVNYQEEDRSLVAAEYKREKFPANENIWNQMREIVKFCGPAVGLWLCGPLMSLIDTAVIGQGSSIELAALGKS